MQKEIKKGNQEFVSKKPVLEFDNFSKKYSRKANYAVHKASFKVFPGEFHGFIGANGAGKTTTIKSLIGAYGTYEGKITIFGKSNKEETIKKRIGYIPEVAKFPLKMKAEKYLTYMAYLSGLNYKASKEFANESIKKLKMETLRKRSPNSFSSGQRKKILLAQSLINNPDLLIMDEPAANLDPKARRDFFNNLKMLQKEGKSIFISSHILDELDQFVDSVTILDGGKIVFTGKIEDIQKKISIFSVKLSNKKDFSKLKQYLEKNKIKFKMNLQEEFIIQPKTSRTFLTISKFIIENKIPFEFMGKKKMTLSDIYKKFVKKGSNENDKGIKND